jgi:hypothetical protein
LFENKAFIFRAKESAMRLILCVLLLVGMAGFLAADDKKEPPKGWKEYSPKDKAFGVWLPEKGGRRSERSSTIHLRGNTVKFDLVQVQQSKGPTYFAAAINLPLQLTRGTTAQQHIEILRDAVVKELTGKIDEEKDVEQGRHKGKEYTVITGQGQARVRIFAVGHRVYEARVAGSKDETTSADADSFLDSFHPGSAGSTTPAAGGTEKSATPAPEPKTDERIASSIVRIIPRDMYGFLKQSVQDKRTVETEIAGFKLAKKQYQDVAADGGILIGFELGFGKFVQNKTINAIRPIYLTADGEKQGEWQGTKPDEPFVIKAKPGYIVGAINIRTGLGIDGLSLKFVKLDKDRLQLKDSYESEWAGGEGGTRATLGGKGYFIVGVCGHLSDQGIPCSLGYVTVLRPKR